MKRILSSVVILTLVVSLCSACGNSQKDVYEQNAEQTDAGAGTEDGKGTDDKDTDGKSGAEDGEAGDGKGQGAEQKELSGELTITALLEFPLNIIAEEFMTLHPGVTVKVEAEDIMNLDPAAYSRRMAVELMSGAIEADLIEASWVDFHKAGRSGLLCDIYEYMDADMNFHKEEYFENVLEALETDGRLYAVPYSFNVEGIFLNKKITDALGVNIDSYESIDYNQIMDMYEKADGMGLLAENFYLDESGKNSVPWSVEMISYYDYKNQRAEFDSPDAIRFLERTKNLRTPLDRGMGFQKMGYSDVRLPDAENCFSVYELLGGQEMELLRMESENWNHLVPLTTTKGQRAISGFAYGIPVAGNQKDLAWEFLKYWMGERDEMKHGDPFCGRIPIKRSNFRKLVEYQCGSLPLDEKLYERFVAIAESANYYFTDNADLGEDMWKQITGDYYLRDLLTAEECAKQLQERTEMYLKE